MQNQSHKGANEILIFLYIARKPGHTIDSHWTPSFDVTKEKINTYPPLYRLSLHGGSLFMRRLSFLPEIWYGGSTLGNEDRPNYGKRKEKKNPQADRSPCLRPSAGGYVSDHALRRDLQSGWIRQAFRRLSADDDRPADPSVDLYLALRYLYP